MLAVINIFGYFIRKLLGVERRHWFSYNHINKQHRIADWTVRIMFVVLYIIFAFYTLSNDIMEIPWYFESWFIILSFIFVSETVRTVMEWKYDENRKAYVATIIEMLFMGFLVVGMIAGDIFSILSI
ncbi:DUF4181 domain-containing protein [Bacillus sp. FJAT-27245]|uniref:DUF4181 domain-containing protein n=1 Tax=Bacillus sp. FJAT-27245 TaxID=1684144 RepID=UPI0022B15F15|nr:DUF4181 domain-containing protein [Bacillus sp. FJAT-27245]